MKRLFILISSLFVSTFILFFITSSPSFAQVCPSGSTCYDMTPSECSGAGGTYGSCSLVGGGTGSCCVPEFPTCPGGMECISGVTPAECSGGGGVVQTCQLPVGGFGNCCVADYSCPSGTECTTDVTPTECSAAGGQPQTCSILGGGWGNCCFPSIGATCDPGENCCTCTLGIPPGPGFCPVNLGTNNCNSGYLPVCPEQVLCSEGAPACACQSSSITNCGEYNEACCPGTDACLDPLVCVGLGYGTAPRCLNPCDTAADCGTDEVCRNGGCVHNPVLPPPPGSSINVQIFCDSEGNPTTTNTGDLYTAIGCIPFTSGDAFIRFILRWGIGIGGGIAFLLIIIAAFQIITSSGDPKKLQAGRELLTSAVAGLVLLIFSVLILDLIGVKLLNIPGFG